MDNHTNSPFFCFSLTSVFGLLFLSGRELLLTDKRIDISCVLRLFKLMSVMMCVWILPPADFPLRFACSSETCGLKKRRKRESSWRRNESRNSYLAFLRSSVMSLSQIRLAVVRARTAKNV